MARRWKLLLVLVIAAAWLWLILSPGVGAFIDRLGTELLPAWVATAGVFGPLAIIALMTLAIVASPLPSAPIALVAGAAYGHTAGTVYVALGAELGALAAFLIARYLGRDSVERLLGDKAGYGLLGSQNALTLTVFVSRLLPFISFDAMSYAAGLSRLHLRRFLLATLAGIIPASFVLAHLGSAAVTGASIAQEWVVFGLGLLTAAPLLWAALWRPRGKDGTGA